MRRSKRSAAATAALVAAALFSGCDGSRIELADGPPVVDALPPPAATVASAPGGLMNVRPVGGSGGEVEVGTYGRQ